MGNMVRVVITLVIALSLFPVVFSFVATAKLNATASQDVILDLIPLIYIFVVIAIVIAELKFGKER